MEIKKKISRGDLFYYDFGEREGSIQSGVRPVLVVQANEFNTNAPTIIASVSLIMMASFLNLNTIIRIFLISIALIIIILSIISIILTDSKTGYYECPSCHHQFMPTIHEYVKGYHTFTKRYLRCPKCKKTNLCRRKLK